MNKSYERPNILFIMSDDHAAQAISSYGSILNQTPNIDRIGKEGIRHESCYCTNSLCAPSRAAILTGTHNHINGVTTLATEIDNRKDNVAKQLKAGGYQTALIGKWHLGDSSESRPTGFDDYKVFIGANGQGEYFDPLFRVNGKEERVRGYATDIVTDMTLDWLKNRDDSKPFFLMCHHKAPHRNFKPHPRHADLYEGDELPEPENLYDRYDNRAKAAAAARMRVGRDMNAGDLGVEEIPQNLVGDERTRWCYQHYIKQYLRTLAAVDEGVGRLLDYLDEAGLAGNTMVVYTSDQGFFLGEHGWYDKRFMYEESLRMPMLVRYPKKIESGQMCDEMVTNVDFAPTFLDYAGLPIPESMQGVSFRSLHEKKTPKDWQQSVYYRYWTNGTPHNVAAHYGIRTKRYKLIYYYADSLGQTASDSANPELREWELFDLDRDPGEMRNVYHDPSYSETVRELEAELTSLQQRFGDSPPILEN